MRIIDIGIATIALFWMAFQAIRYRKEALWIVFMSLALFNGVFAIENSTISTLMSAIFVATGILIIGKKVVDNNFKVFLKWDLILLIVFAIILFAMLPNGYKGSSDYGSHKAFMFIIHALLPVIAIRIGNVTDLEIERFLQIALSLTFFMLLRSIVGIGMTTFRLSGGESGALGTARILSVGLIISLVQIFLVKNDNAQKKRILILLSVLFAIIIFLTGSRAGIFYSVVSFVLANELYKNNKNLQRKNSSLKIILLFILFLLIGIFIGGVFELEAVTRILASIPGLNKFFYSQHALSSNEGRFELVEFCIDYIKNHGIRAIGTGQFSTIHPKGYKITYPHNIILENLIENGLLSTLMLIVLLIIPISSILKSRRYYVNQNMVCLATLFFFFLFDSLTSGDIAKNFQLWSIGALVITCFENLQSRNVDQEGMRSKTDE